MPDYFERLYFKNRERLLQIIEWEKERYEKSDPSPNYSKEKQEGYMAALDTVKRQFFKIYPIK